MSAITKKQKTLNYTINMINTLFKQLNSNHLKYFGCIGLGAFGSYYIKSEYFENWKKSFAKKSFAQTKSSVRHRFNFVADAIDTAAPSVVHIMR